MTAHAKVSKLHAEMVMYIQKMKKYNKNH